MKYFVLIPGSHSTDRQVYSTRWCCAAIFIWGWFEQCRSVMLWSAARLILTVVLLCWPFQDAVCMRCFISSTLH